MLIATNRTDLSADTIALLYKYRWQVEVFFRFFKHILGCRHLLSYCDNGVELQVYAGIITCLLIALYTGRKPTKRTYEMFCWYLSGWADEEELLEHIESLKNQN
jgi:IS4 transposase